MAMHPASYREPQCKVMKPTDLLMRGALSLHAMTQGALSCVSSALADSLCICTLVHTDAQNR